MSGKHNLNTKSSTENTRSEEVEWSVYTDGGCNPPKRDEPPPTAGAGTAEFRYVHPNVNAVNESQR